jgi:hypothetical protein
MLDQLLSEHLEPRTDLSLKPPLGIWLSRLVPHGTCHLTLYSLACWLPLSWLQVFRSRFKQYQLVEHHASRCFTPYAGLRCTCTPAFSWLDRPSLVSALWQALEVAHAHLNVCK